MKESFCHLGNLDLLDREPVAFFCSSQCDGQAVLAAYEWARRQCDLGTTVISGFHTPVEKDVYAILARRGANLIHCPARSLPKRLTPEQKKLLAKHRLLLLTPFGPEVKRATRETASVRNRFVAERASRIVVAFLHAGSSLADDLAEHDFTRC